MSNVVHTFVLSSAGIDVRVASAEFHSFGGLTLDFASFQLPARSDCWATDGLLTLLCTLALVLLSGLTGHVQTSRTCRTFDIIWAIQSLEPI